MLVTRGFPFSIGQSSILWTLTSLDHTGCQTFRNSTTAHTNTGTALPHMSSNLRAPRSTRLELKYWWLYWT